MAVDVARLEGAVAADRYVERLHLGAVHRSHDAQHGSLAEEALGLARGCSASADHQDGTPLDPEANREQAQSRRLSPWLFELVRGCAGLTGCCGAHRCNPHSVFSEPDQRPERGSAPVPTGLVQGLQPIDG